MAGASRCRSEPKRYPFSPLSDRSWSALRALSGSSLPAPGGRTEGHGGIVAADATTTENQRDPRRGGEGLFICERRVANTAVARTEGQDDDDDEGRGGPAAESRRAPGGWRSGPREPGR